MKWNENKTQYVLRGVRTCYTFQTQDINLTARRDVKQHYTSEACWLASGRRSESASSFFFFLLFFVFIPLFFSCLGPKNAAHHRPAS